MIAKVFQINNNNENQEFRELEEQMAKSNKEKDLIIKIQMQNRIYEEQSL